MFRFTNTQREHVLKGTDDVTLTYATTAFQAGGPFGGAGAAYHRPVRLTSTSSGDMIRIRDHVMLARLAVVALFLSMMVLRWAR